MKDLLEELAFWMLRVMLKMLLAVMVIIFGWLVLCALVIDTKHTWI